MRQKCILLRAIEAMNLVDEDDGARAVLPRPLGLHHHLLDLFDPGHHRRILDELRLGAPRNDLRQRRLSYSRRSPEEDRADVIALNLHPQRLTRRKQMLLPHKFIQVARTHPVRQRTRAVGCFINRIGKKIHRPQAYHR